ncbi:hypothetical protein J6590_097323, partial [Homalodisca vitripennis]
TDRVLEISRWIRLRLGLPPAEMSRFYLPNEGIAGTTSITLEEAVFHLPIVKGQNCPYVSKTPLA